MLREMGQELQERSYDIQNGCRVCEGELDEIVSLGNLALTSYWSTKDDAPRIPLTLCRCNNCELVQLRENTKPSLMYREGYGYKSGVNESMVRHLREIADKASKYLNPGDKILDIGCNDGTLLRQFKGVFRVGFDPIADDVEGCSIVRDYFKYHGVRYKVITSIAMLYDLKDPVGFAIDIADSLEDDGIWLLEVGYAGTLLDGKWDGICHEHLEYYGLKQISEIASRAGLKIKWHEFNETNGGSILVCIGKEGEDRELEKTIEKESKWDWSDFASEVGMSAKNIRKSIGKRKVYALGASTKGNTLLQVSGITNQMVVAAVERQKDKVGKVTPGTNIPIISEEEARDNPPDAFLVLPYHLKDSLLEREKGLRGRVKFIFPMPSITEC